MKPIGRARALLHAARPRTLPAAAAPVLVGAGLAAARHSFAALPALGCLVCALLIQVGANYANDYSDFVRGADTEERAGELRVTQAGLLSPAQVRWAATASFLLAAIAGGWLVALGGVPILLIGLAAIVAAVAYTGGPWPYGYHGLGELFVFLFFGLAAVTGTAYLQTGAWSWESLWAGAGVGAMTTAVLVVNNLRDIATDSRAGKLTLAVILGPRATRAEYLLLLAFAALVPVGGVWGFGWPATVLLSLAGFLPGLGAARQVVRSAERPEEASRLDPALAATARSLGLYGLLFAAGLAL